MADDRPVVVVATEDTARAWAQALVARGVPAVACPFARVAPPADGSAVARALGRGEFDLVVATSANAVRYLPAGAGGGREAAAVGATTARALAERGFRVAIVGEAGSEDLARRLLASGRPRRALWLRGERAREEGGDLLREGGWTVEEVTAYRTVPEEGFASLAAAAAARAWVLGSPAAAEALAAALGSKRFPPPAGGAAVIAAGETAARAARVPGRPAPRVPRGTGTTAVVAAVLEALAGPTE